MFRDEAIPLSRDVSSPELFSDPTFPARPHDENNLDDIWGSGPSSADSEGFPSDANHIRYEPSDIPRLRSEHSTSGYRDGLSSAKNTTIQEGFDEGYSLGAVMGLEIGIVMGVLEGVCNSIRDVGGDNEGEKKRTNGLLENARRELQTERVFGSEWWGEDGTWKYEVIGERPDGTGDFTFKEVVNSHPVVKKWKGLVQIEAEKWGLDLTIMEREEEKRVASDDEGYVSRAS
jgi:hypothetical protein